MKNTPKFLHLALVFTAIFGLLTSGMALAQGASGKGAIYGSVEDTDGANIPGVTITLSGTGAPKVAITDGQGQFRFVQLDVGTYKLVAALDGFSTVEYPEVVVGTNQNVSIQVTMQAALEEVITVTSESPILDERKIAQETTLSRMDLDKIPTARDPFEIVRQAPGVVVDRVNVGGNESGQQSTFLGTGAFGDQNKFLIDGVDVTDQSALGGSATYFGFEQFEEIQLSTGGTDITVMTPGVQVQMITKRGGNEWRGSATGLWTDGAWQSDPNLSEGDIPPDQLVDPDGNPVNPDSLTGNQIRLIRTWGAEAGGSVVRDRLFFWGAYDFNNIDQDVFGDIGIPPQADDTELENLVGKINAQIVPENSLEVSWNQGDKIKAGRGASPSTAPESTWNQSGPSPAWKAETTHVVNSSFFVTAHWSRMAGGFALEPIGGRDVNQFVDADGIQRGSARWLDTVRPTYRWQLNASNFFNTGETSHELKYGAAFRKAGNISSSAWPGSGDLRGAEYASGATIGGLADDQIRLRAWRQRTISNSVEYSSIWAQDTFTKGRFTVNAGLRLDIQEGSNDPTSAPAGALADIDTDGDGVPEGLPALDFGGNNGAGIDPNTGEEIDAFEWSEITPRIGVTYALGEDRKTLLRANYSRFSEQMGTDTIERVNPLGFAWSQFYFTDLNGNFLLDDNERDSLEFQFTQGGGSLADPDFSDPGLDAPTHDELSFGVEHSFAPTLVGSATALYRRQSDILETRTLVTQDADGFVRTTTPADWQRAVDPDTGELITVTGNLPNGEAYSQPVFELVDGLTNAGGTFLTNGSRTTDYLGLNFGITKRLANQWMLRANLSWNDWTWNIDDEFLFFDDPTDNLDVNTNPAGGAGADNDGSQVTQTSAGSGPNDNYLSSNWSFNLMGLYQVAPDRPWGFNVAANVSGREGFPVPFFETVSSRNGGIGAASVQVTDEVDSVRLDDVYTFDLRIDKDWNFGDFGVTVGLDAFNIFNEGTVLGRENDLTDPRADFVDQTLGPRIFRLQLKLSYK